jgi:hypothetical protein
VASPGLAAKALYNPTVCEVDRRNISRSFQT